ncbi:hypothetical protein L207DRAFT_638973 [Hyaloscypha variabilis F]|uniref:C2H2-type domain-containing protein n=1 Tax=Hyaloscypha variabilis (strain UAMH 11265 / GT02V1 / F) TaxID=1149755 RepID=A0A2J6R7M7_HYAVF|nr:hypothetical protein L207DRAFT_638973 [Hyaloscypha variabilis F]
MDSTKQREGQVPQEAAIINHWANSAIDPSDLLSSFQPFEAKISDINAYLTVTPNDTPESSRDGISEPNSKIEGGIGLDINVDIFDDSRMPFGISEFSNLFNQANSVEDLSMFDDEQQGVDFQSYVVPIDAAVLPFSCDTPLYSQQGSGPVGDRIPPTNFSCDYCPKAFSRQYELTPWDGSTASQMERIANSSTEMSTLGAPIQQTVRDSQSQESFSDAAHEKSQHLGSHISASSFETKSPKSNELQVYQVASSGNGYSSENPSEGNPPSCDHLQTSSTALREDNQTLTTYPTQSFRRLSLPTYDDKSVVKPMRNDDSDYGESEANGSVQDLYFSGFSAFPQKEFLFQEQVKDSLTQPVFSPMKQELIDRIMKEFWVMFNQESEAIQNRSPTALLVDSAEKENGNTDINSTGGEESSRNVVSSSFTGSINTSQKYTQNTLGRRRREEDDDQEQNNREERDPKRPRTLLSPPRNPDDSTKFACPYRKRDPRKYCVKHWRSCALTPQDTVARVKGHLYRHHRISPCQRCKVLFKDQNAVNVHLMQQIACERKDIEHIDGVTTEIFEKLRSKKKAQKDQTEADRWKDIYKSLFPNEMVPSPYFEEVQDDIILSPGSRELADYEDYCRRELPRRVRTALEEIVHNESQPMEESIRNQLINIIRDCQDLVFSSYRSSSAVAAAVVASVGTPSRNSTASEPPFIAPQGPTAMVLMSSDGTPERSLGHTESPFFQPPPPQTHLRSGLEVSDLQSNIITKAPDGSDPSDSGYSSNDWGILSRISSSNDTNDSSSLPNSEPHIVCSRPATANAQSTWDMDSGFDLNTGNVVTPSHGASTFDQSCLDYDSQSAEGDVWNSYLSNLGIEYPFSSD